MEPVAPGIEHLWRDLTPQVLGIVARRSDDFGAAEDAVQEALLSAALRWPRDGVPENPRAWLIHVALRRLVDRRRSEGARRNREALAVQAAIAAVHDEAARAEETDWPQILALYELLKEMTPNPVVLLNHAIAAAMVEGPARGLDLIAGLEGDRRLADHHRLHAVRAHLLEMMGDREGARVCYRKAAAKKLAASRSATTCCSRRRTSRS